MLAISNYQELKIFLSQLKKKPTLLLHSCCGPCSTHTLKLLVDYFEVTLFFDNPNLDTEEEFNLRLETQKEVLKHFPMVSLIVSPYQPDQYYHAVEGYEHLGEHSARCEKCMGLRIRNTASYARNHHFDYFTTTLSISPHKNSALINRLGSEAALEFSITFLYSDFKKENGYQDSVKLSKEWNLYRQDYCGCKFSKAERVRENE